VADDMCECEKEREYM